MNRQIRERIPGLDGLRGGAVIAVFVFHAGYLSGGFIGVDVFFVVSGFLITGLILAEVDKTGKLDVGQFWRRRARRLLPALFVVSAAILLFAIVTQDQSLVGTIRRDALGALLYATNWIQISADQDYFAAYSRPSPFKHTWSLAIEEQFYVVWPLLVWLAVAFTKKRPSSFRSVIGVISAVVAAASFGRGWWLANIDDAAFTKLYYSTDVRIGLVAVGSLASCVLPRPGKTLRQHMVVRYFGFLSLATLIVLCWVVDGSERWWYPWGGMIVAGATLVLIVAVHCESAVGGLLSWDPLAAVGRVSYGIYLWHWPVMVLLDSDRVGLSGWVLAVFWALVTALLTCASWFLVEKRAPLPGGFRSTSAISYTASGLALVVFAVVTPPLIEFAETDDSGDLATLWLDESDEDATSSTTGPGAQDSASTPITSAITVPASAQVTTSTAAPLEATSAPTVLLEQIVPRHTIEQGRPLRIMLLGDSVADSLPRPTKSLDLPGIGEVVFENNGVISCPVWEAGDWKWTDPVGIIKDPPYCEGPDRFQPAIDLFDPDLIIFMFGWSGGSQRVFSDGSQLGACEQEFLEPWTQAYADLIERFDEDIAVVVTNIADYVGDAAVEHADKTECLNQAIAEATDQIVDVRLWLCPGGDCTLSSDLRPDGLHFTPDEVAQTGILKRLLLDSIEVAFGEVG